MPFIEHLARSIDGRIRELHGEIHTLQQARSTLVANGAAPKRSAKTTRPKPAARRRRPMRMTADQLTEATQQVLANSDGLSAAALAQQVGAHRDQMLALLHELQAEGRVRRTGQRRSTRWQLITEEDWIRERTAELASRRARADR